MLGLLCSAAVLSMQDEGVLQLDLSSPGPKVSRSLFGVFFEEINNAGEGGIYGELLNNRALAPGRSPGKPEGWLGENGTFLYDQSQKLNEARDGSIRFTTEIGKEGALVNTGFWGIGVKKGQDLTLRIWARGRGKVTPTLNEGNQERAEAEGAVLTTEWQEFKFTLKPKSDGKAILKLNLTGGSEMILGYSTLMPNKGWKGRAGGWRSDLAEMMLDLQPGFLRFPGGCYVEGNDLSNRFEWRDTLKPIHERKATPFTFWGYPSSNGLGYHEYLQMCEDMKAEPMFVINCGMSHSEIQPMDKMDVYVQDALDAIQYAIGPVTSRMGALRAANGRVKPFPLKYIEIGNENGYNWSYGGPAPYYERFKLIHEAIKARYPQIITISNVPTPVPGDLTSEHFYENPAWFWNNKDRYDKYPRKGPGIYVGEYAVTRANGRGSLAGALGEAAYMTGLEKNADIVAMASYAPLFENVNRRQWNPNAINFDATRSFGTPSYWVQQVFAQNRINVAVKSKITEAFGEPPQVEGQFGFKTWRTTAEFKDVKISIQGRPVYTAAEPKLSDFNPSNGMWSEVNGTLKQTTLDEDALLTLKNVVVKPSDNWTFEFKAKSLSGEEGFMGVFGFKSQGELLQWNLGGWGNTIHAFQRDHQRTGVGATGKIAPQAWTDIRIQKDGSKISGFINGRLVEELVEKAPPSLAASAGIDVKKKELVVKIVNGSNRPQTVKLQGLLGAKGKTWNEIVLTGPSLSAENSFENPENVAPKITKRPAGDSITTVPRSLTVLRIPLSGDVLKPALNLLAEGRQ